MMEESNLNIDVLMNGRKWVPIKEVAYLNPKLPMRPEDEGVIVSFLPMKNVSEERNKIDLTETKAYSEVKKGYTPFSNGDVIFAKITPCMENGKIAVVSGLKNGIGFGSTEFHVLRPSSMLNNHFLFYYLVRKRFRHDAEASMTGAVGQRRVPKKFLEDALIPLPPLDQQHQIVSKLEELFSELDKSIEQLKTAQQQLKVYRQSVLLWAFEGELTNENVKEGELQEGWKWVKLNEIVVKIQIGPFGSQLHKEDYIENGTPLINPIHIGSDKLMPNRSYTITERKRDSLPNYILRADDVIMGRRGEMGRCGLISEKEDGWFCGTGSLYIRPNVNLVLSKFLLYQLKGQRIKKYLEENAAGTTMANLNGKIVSSIPLAMTSFEQQQQIIHNIETRLSVADKLEDTINQSLQQSEALRQSILKEAFEGKLVKLLKQNHGKSSNSGI